MILTVSPGPGALAGDDGDLFKAFAQQADSLGFDLLLLGFGEDRLDLEPLTAAAALCALTQRIGLCAKATTRLGEPFTLARGFAALDHLSRGRAAWQVSTRVPSLAAPFMHRPSLAESDGDAAGREFLEATFALWDSWGADALTFDKESAEFSNPERVHTVDYEGRFFSVRGPLNTPRPRQGRPIIVHAAGTDIDWAAATGDILILGAGAGGAEVGALAARYRQSAAARQRRLKLLLETTGEGAEEAIACAQGSGLDGVHLVTSLSGLSRLSGLRRLSGLGVSATGLETDGAHHGSLRDRLRLPI